MRHLVDYRKLERSSAHRKALLRNLATSLILHERIETTLSKAKELRRLADHLITLGKEGSLHARRQAAAILLDKQALGKLFDGLAARFKDRAGGYTRIFQFGFRRGDGASMAAIEYLGYQLPVKEKKEDKEKGKKKEKEKKKPKVEVKVEKKVEKKAEKKEKKEAAPEKKAKKEAKKPEKKEEKKWSLFGRKKKDK